ncbi:hypothetical protein Ga0123462_1224 [Mariprofundus ferrinatatus]|uniref:DUF2062 domain-containing protein n=1 Tax=Mariprofundus ferrinatatus TaxID=1921087 RepID=A0A2K8L432_9PROT|nr:DUF2062 domain-containing protein [Mariprofundus ferrinatatus]ATX82088.1 hypothetical protein Ga0123462_1224 [Mariprofundus ferrinatatus]
MPRKLLKRLMPDHRKIRDHKHLQIFGKLLHNPALWHLNRHSVAKAFAVGLFFAWVPVPFQMVLAAGGAIIFHANLPLSVALVWLTNPLTMPPMFYGAYKLGAFVLGREMQHFEMELSYEWLEHEMSLIWEPFLLGCLIVGVLSSIIGYIGIQIAWRSIVMKRWRKRMNKHVRKQ